MKMAVILDFQEADGPDLLSNVFRIKMPNLVLVSPSAGFSFKIVVTWTTNIHLLISKVKIALKVKIP